MSAARGFTAIPNSVVRDATMPPATRLLYGVILSYAWGARACTASADTLCGDAGIGRSAFFDALTLLRERGLLDIQKRRSKNGWRNVYVPIARSGIEITDADEGSPEDGLGVVHESDEGLSATRTQKKTKGEEDATADAVDTVRAGEREQQTLSVELDAPLIVWRHYAERRWPDKPPRDLPPEERRIIVGALRVADVEKCCEAIDGCWRSDWHQGKNPSGAKYHAISQILKGKRGGKTTREQIDFMAALLHAVPVANGNGRRQTLGQALLGGWDGV